MEWERPRHLVRGLVALLALAGGLTALGWLPTEVPRPGALWVPHLLVATR